MSQRGSGSPRDARVWCVRAAISLYVVWMLVNPPSWVSPGIQTVWRWPKLQVYMFVEPILRELGFAAPSRFLRSEVYFLLTAFLVPLVFCLLTGRGRPKDTGWRRPNRLLFRIVGSSLLVSIPFLAWMVRSPEFLPFYRSYIEAGPLRIVVYYIVVLFCEHFFFEGVMLAAFRTDGCWPTAPRIVQNADAGWRRVAQWFGIAQPTKKTRGLKRVARWLGIPDGCVGAIILSGVLFGLVHWGKAGREYFLAFPGGVFLAFLAYRCNSWHAPYLLHAGTVTVAAIAFSLLYL